MLMAALWGGLSWGVVSCSEDLDDDWLAGSESQGLSEGFQWTRAEDVETQSKFLRNQGLGYSYNAVHGEYCNWKDIRCQVVDRSILDFREQMSGSKYYSFLPSQSTVTYTKFRHSLRDYVATMSLNLEEEVDLGLYEKTRRKNQYFIENGVQETYYFMSEETHNMYVGRLDYQTILNLLPKYPRMLTRSFREAVVHVEESDIQDIAVVDSFVKVWGTHVIVNSFLGGKLSIDLSNYSWRFRSIGYDSKEEMEEAFLGALASKDVDRQTKDGFGWIQDGNISVQARGGDLSCLTDLLGDYRYDGKRDFSTEGISKWRQSLKYDPDHPLESNVELTDMRVVPIWTFAEAISPTAAERIKAAINQDISLMKSVLGEKNFCNTKFPIRYRQASVLWRADDDKWEEYTFKGLYAWDFFDDEPMVNIESGGRYVATVAKEYHDSLQLWVCYPIYDGKVNEACGLGVDESTNKVYNVKWFPNGRCSIENTGDIAKDDMFYLNDGKVSVRKQEDTDYAVSHQILASELCGGVQTDGTYLSYKNHPWIQHPWTVYRRDGKTFCFVNWNLQSDVHIPDIPGYEPLEYQRRENGTYVYKGGPVYRDSTYYYIYNPNELRYVE